MRAWVTGGSGFVGSRHPSLASDSARMVRRIAERADMLLAELVREAGIMAPAADGDRPGPLR